MSRKYPENLFAAVYPPFSKYVFERAFDMEYMLSEMLMLLTPDEKKFVRVYFEFKWKTMDDLEPAEMRTYWDIIKKIQGSTDIYEVIRGKMSVEEYQQKREEAVLGVLKQDRVILEVKKETTADLAMSGYPQNVYEKMCLNEGRSAISPLSINQKDTLIQLMNKILTPKKIDIIKLRYRDLLTYEEIANRYHVSRNRIAQILAQSFRELRGFSRCVETASFDINTILKDSEGSFDEILIEELLLSKRSYHALQRKGFKCVQDVIDYINNFDTKNTTKKWYDAIRNCGVTSATEIQTKLLEIGADIRMEPVLSEKSGMNYTPNYMKFVECHTLEDVRDLLVTFSIAMKTPIDVNDITDWLQKDYKENSDEETEKKK